MTKGTDPTSLVSTTNKAGTSILAYGLTKREQFAAMAMQGMLHAGVTSQYGIITHNPGTIAGLAVLQADALINALNKKD